MKNTIEKEMQISRLKLLTKIQEKSPKFLKEDDREKVLPYVKKVKERYQLNERGVKECEKLREALPLDKKRLKFYSFEKREIKKIIGEDVIDIFKVFVESREVDEETEYQMASAQQNDGMFPIVEHWKENAAVYCFIGSLLHNKHIRELPKIGKLKKLGGDLVLDPHFVFSIKFDGSLEEMEKKLRRITPNFSVVKARNFYTANGKKSKHPMFSTVALSTDYEVTCFNSTEAALIQLVIDLPIIRSSFDITELKYNEKGA